MQGGELSAGGSLERFQLQGHSELSTPVVQGLKFALKADGSPRKLTLSSLKLTLGKGELVTRGDLQLAPHLSWSGETELKQLDPAHFDPQLPGAISGTVKSRFDLIQGHWQLAIADLALNGELRGYPLRSSGGASLNERFQWQADALNLETGDNRVRLDGSPFKGRG